LAEPGVRVSRIMRPTDWPVAPPEALRTRATMVAIARQGLIGKVESIGGAPDELAGAVDGESVIGKLTLPAGPTGRYRGPPNRRVEEADTTVESQRGGLG